MEALGLVGLFLGWLLYKLATCGHRTTPVDCPTTPWQKYESWQDYQYLVRKAPLSPYELAMIQAKSNGLSRQEFEDLERRCDQAGQSIIELLEQVDRHRLSFERACELLSDGGEPSSDVAVAA